MILSYRDHAANERTFLAWIRTGLTVMALGFVIERLDLFLAGLAPGTGGADAPTPAPPEIHYMGVALVGLGVVVIAGATWRFVRINRAIDAQEEEPSRATALPIGMALLLLGAGVALVLYLLRLI